MFVRSPTITKFVSGVIANGSRPLKLGARRRSGTRRGGTPSTAAAIARMCSGVVPQQPPTTFTSPSRAKSPRIAARVGRLLVVRAERVRQPRVRVARRPRSARCARDPRRTAASRSRRARS